MGNLSVDFGRLTAGTCNTQVRHLTTLGLFCVLGLLVTTILTSWLILCVAAYPDACYPVKMDGGVGVAGEGVCPACRLPFDSGKKRRLIDSCGHERCYSCMFSSEVCPLCVAGGEYSSVLRHRHSVHAGVTLIGICAEMHVLVLLST